MLVVWYLNRECSGITSAPPAANLTSKCKTRSALKKVLDNGEQTKLILNLHYFSDAIQSCCNESVAVGGACYVSQISSSHEEPLGVLKTT